MHSAEEGGRDGKPGVPVPRANETMRFEKMRRLKSAWMMIALLFVIALRAPCAFAATKDGFVTNVSTPMSFDISATHITLNQQTRCETQPVFLSNPMVYISLVPVPGRWINKKSLKIYKASHAFKMQTIACASLQLAVGSRVHLVGRLSIDGQFEVNELVKYAITSDQTLVDGVLLEEASEIHRDADNLSDMKWIDGYPMSITSQTKLVGEPMGTTFRYKFGMGNGIADINAKSSSRHAEIHGTAEMLVPNTWVLYHADSSTNGTVTANQLQFWPNSVRAKEDAYLKHFNPTIVLPDYNNKIPGSISYGNTGAVAVKIVPDQAVQEWVSNVGSRLIPLSQQRLTDTEPTKLHFHFYVVHRFPLNLGEYFVLRYSTMPSSRLELWDRDSKDFYPKPRASEMTSEVIATPDGNVLVPDTVLSALHNEAQLATLLSCAITSIIQRQSYHAWPVYIIPNVLERNSAASYAFSLFPVQSTLDEQMLRNSIRQMYLTGYDIREAPFAGTVAAGETILNPVLDSESTGSNIPGYTAYDFSYMSQHYLKVDNSRFKQRYIPWYTAYAFNYISQYYKDVDYSKLKRGEAEYAQFLDELRKADPDAFEVKK